MARPFLVSFVAMALSASPVVASMAHALPFPFGPQALPLNQAYGSKRGAPFFAYGRSKRANVLSAISLANRYEGTDGNGCGVTALSLCPGNVRTNLGQSNVVAWVMYEAACLVVSGQRRQQS